MIICSIENLDAMGVHTGDSITVAPAQTLTDREYQMMRDGAIAIMREIGVETGGSNVQFAINPENGEMIVIEMNPRVSRSSALASKATGFPIAKMAAKLAIGYTLDELPNDITRETMASFEPTIDYVVTKIPPLGVREIPRQQGRTDHGHEECGRDHGHRPARSRNRSKRACGAWRSAGPGSWATARTLATPIRPCCEKNWPNPTASASSGWPRP